MTLPLALLALVAAQSPVAAAPKQTALVVIGDGLSTRELRAAEQGLRGAAVGFALQDTGTTSQRLDAAGSRGFACALRSVDCLVQVGVVCGVEQVLLADLVEGGKLALLLVDVNEGVATRATSVAHKDPAAALAALADPAALEAAAAIGPKEAAPPVAPPAPAPVAPPPAPPLPEPASAAPIVGIVGGSVLVVAGAVAAGIGSLDQLTAGDSAQKLAVLEGQAAEQHADPAYLESVRVERARFDKANASWVDVGQPLVAVGAALIGIGVGAVVVATVWLAE